MKKVTRTFETHKIYPATVKVENGQVVTEGLAPITVFNDTMSQEKALKLTRKQYGRTGNYVIMDIITTKDTYEMPVDKFIELADLFVKANDDVDDDDDGVDFDDDDDDGVDFDDDDAVNDDYF